MSKQELFDYILKLKTDYNLSDKEYILLVNMVVSGSNKQQLLEKIMEFDA